MKFVLFIVIINASPHGTDDLDMWWAIDGNLTYSDCQARLAEVEPMRAEMFGKGAETRLVCDSDRAPETWGN